MYSSVASIIGTGVCWLLFWLSFLYVFMSLGNPKPMRAKFIGKEKFTYLFIFILKKIWEEGSYDLMSRWLLRNSPEVIDQDHSQRQCSVWCHHHRQDKVKTKDTTDLTLVDWWRGCFQKEDDDSRESLKWMAFICKSSVVGLVLSIGIACIWD